MRVIISRFATRSALICTLSLRPIYWTSAAGRLHARFCRHRQPQLGSGRVEIRYPRGGKTVPAGQLCVASSQRLPFEDASLDAIVRIYAPCNAVELARVVRPGGWVITATPGPRHPMELKGLIYDEVRLHEQNAEEMAGFTLRHQQQLAYPMQLNGSEAEALANDAVCVAG